MKKLLMASTAAICFGTMASADDVNVGIILGFTGPLESITPAMAAGAELAIAEINAAGGVAGPGLSGGPGDRRAHERRVGQSAGCHPREPRGHRNQQPNRRDIADLQADKQHF